MKKILLSAVALVAMSLSALAAPKTVTFDFSAQGYANAQDFDGKSVKLDDGLTVTWSKGTGSTTPKYYNTGTAMRLYGGNTATFAADGDITKIVFTYSGTNIAKADNSAVSTGTYDYDSQTWTGASKQMALSFTATGGHLRILSVAVTYDVEYKAPTGTFDDLYVPLKFDGVNYKVNDEWENAVIDQENGKSEVKFSTSNIEFLAVGGTTPKDVELNVGEPFAGWTAGWNDVKWDRKNQNLDDMKTRYFAYIVGTGNPVVAIDAEEVTTDGQQTGRWRAKYTYYGPKEMVTYKSDGTVDKAYKRELPKQGLYYEFAAKKDGTLKIAVWSNKGKRNTFVIDKATMEPVAFTCEGYYNGQNEGDPLNEGKNQKKWLTNDDIVALHNNAFTRQAVKNEDGTTKVDEAGNTVYETIEDAYPYVIADGNQNFWGYLVMPLKAGQTYLLFQDSSQIGFAGFQFTDGDVAEGDLFSAKASVFLPEGIAKVDGVTYNGDNTFSAAAGTEVTIQFADPCTEYTLTGVTGTITPSSGAWVVKSAENGTVVIAYEGTSEDAKYAVSFTSDANETFSIANTGEVTAIANVATDNTTVAPRKVLVNGQIMIGNYNIAGQRVK